MKNILLVLFILLINIDAKDLIYKDKGVIKSLSAIENENVFIVEEALTFVRYFKRDTYLIVRYNLVNPLLVSEVEDNLNVENIRILSNGDFIYKVTNDRDIFEVCSEIAKIENVVNVKPAVSVSVRLK